MPLSLTVAAVALAALLWAHGRFHRAHLTEVGFRGGPGRPTALPRGPGHHVRTGRGEAARFCYAVDPLRCTRCEACLKFCPTGALRRTIEGVTVDPLLCQACGRCAERCKRGALLRLHRAA